MNDKVGIVYGESSTDRFTFIANPDNLPKFGEFVVVTNREGEEVLGVVKRVINVNWLMSAGRGNYAYIEKTVSAFSKGVLEKSEALIVEVRTLGVVNGSEVMPNRFPIRPGTEVYLAKNETLQGIFSQGHIEIGKLLARKDVEVKLDVDRLVSRHFAVLAVTGAGKSNAISVLSKEIIEKAKGTIIIIDPHGEYVHLKLDKDKANEDKVNVIPTKIDPSRISLSELMTLLSISENATRQRRFLSMAYHTVRKEAEQKGKVLLGMSFLEALEDKIEEWIRAADEKREVVYYNARGYSATRKMKGEDMDSLIRILDHIQELKTWFGDYIGETEIVRHIQKGKVNVIDLSGMEEEQMITVASYILRELLKKRIDYVKAKRDLGSPIRGRRERAKKILREFREKYPALTRPILTIVEEAHIFAPRGGKTEASHWLGKIAREGRKFGIGLGIVSQRPKKLDDDILSQTNTKIILRLVEPNDQRYVQQASEEIGEDLLQDIASLGVGEAVIVGYAIKLPAMVKIYNFKEELNGDYGGGDIEIYSEWKEEIEEEGIEISIDDLVGE